MRAPVRKSEPTRSSSRPARLGAGALALGLLAPAIGLADAEAESRYPYDPACPWGRIANGKGMLHRCITEAEAKRLLETTTDKASPQGPDPVEAKSADDKSEDKPAEAAPASAPVEVTIGGIEAEEGNLSVGALNKPMDRYAQCVEQNGGLEKTEAKVVVRFLVRAERSRAEGTEVDSFRGLSQKAARCIADVVDRRRVGTPEVPMTGARLTFEIRNKP